MRNLLEITDLTTKEIDGLIALALEIIAQPEKYGDACRGKKLATLFYEPSTRTRLSFEAAMMELGGNVLGFSDAAASSVSKGETVADTVRVVENFADIIAMRHNMEGAPFVAAQYAKTPIINAGDGGHCHPTQTLTDLLTIFREKGKLNNLTIGFCGDLKFGRTVHSLSKALGRYSGIKFLFISPNELKIPDYLKQDMDKAGYDYLETNSLETSISELDILYMTRVQKERFEDEEDYNRLKNSFILDTEKLKEAKKDMLILHPLPRVNEIKTDVDNDPRACYFKQVLNGKYIRMALIYTLLQWKECAETKTYNNVIGEKCQNLRCISSIEDVKPLYKMLENGDKRCFYCDFQLCDFF
jgi:aspartate carbamoyltransferase catalytic subunit